MNAQIKCNVYTVLAGFLLVVLTQSSAICKAYLSDSTRTEKGALQADSAIQATTTSATSLPVAVFKSKQVITSLPEALVSDQIKCLQATIPLTYNKFSKKFINSLLTKQRKFITQMAERQQMYFPMYEAMLEKYGLPLELKYLSIVESALNPKAVSKAKAAGLWQFMPSTGRYFKLYQDAYIDERMHPLKATEAACLYLKSLYTTFGDWHLALAAYNCGPGNVRRAIRRSGNKTTFWQIYNHLPAETRAYVPKFIAINYVMQYADAYNIETASSARLVPSDTILVNQYVNMELLAKMIHVPLEDLRMLNPHVKKNIIPAYLKNYIVHIPAEKKDSFVVNRTHILAAMVKKRQGYMTVSNSGNTQEREGYRKVLYKVKPGDVLYRIALKHHVSVVNLQKWNSLKSNSIKPGRVLVIWKPIIKSALAVNSLKTVPAQANSVKPVLIPQIKVYFVQPGDTLSKISQIHGGVSVERIIKYNRLTSKKIRPGQKLIIS